MVLFFQPKQTTYYLQYSIRKKFPLFDSDIITWTTIQYRQREWRLAGLRDGLSELGARMKSSEFNTSVLSSSDFSHLSSVFFLKD